MKGILGELLDPGQHVTVNVTVALRGSMVPNSAPDVITGELESFDEHWVKITGERGAYFIPVSNIHWITPAD
jgi:hypothetical protein